MSEEKPEPWLTIIGIGDNGLSSLSPSALSLIWQADTIVVSERLDTVLEGMPPKTVLNWAEGFHDVLEKVIALRGRPTTVLATGDPMHFGIGATLRRHFEADEMRIIPSPSAFSLAASRLGWPLQDVDQISLHGRSVETLVRYLQPTARIIALTSDASTIREAAELIQAHGFSGSHIHVLEHMGGEAERSGQYTVEDILEGEHDFSDFNTIGIRCIRAPHFHPLIAGLDDDAFEHDGQLTKKEVRAVTLSHLRPYRNALLWDIGAGCGSIAIEWMRTGGRAVAVEAESPRVEMIRNNAARLGVPALQVVEGRAPAALDGLKRPDAVFIGGGMSGEGVFEACWEALKPGGRMVANAVTVEGEMALASLHAQLGGDLVRIAVSRAEPVGRFSGWKPLMPVTIWSVEKGWE
ncbi:precorrin-6y C5,15-methyltransferase (decarboxylating) subunit CbiE [Rhizobium sp. L1K21]|uniref:precorrin-6y C5,15-methyltransferase (decarboxylating) subunit CbiE n=1 Tax=Rhizobium sp. L1K21 TaxID=2954933 RepID=UPI00209332F8|nr:precorrin-6y C5,15-methyltransferase (decarboxylating) subunit CbiE [Rhizobium sp. L1K21]MCO6185793.1 precorrin-6y C5,15-methyltransferase (decarboxylating) subunit CbiE [Rhizobium sp. L1K21]